MPSVDENIAILSRAAIEQRAGIEADGVMRISAARANLDAAGRADNAANTELAALQSQPLTGFGSDKTAIGKHLLALQVAEVVAGNSGQALAQAREAFAQAEAEFAALQREQGEAFERDEQERAALAKQLAGIDGVIEQLAQLIRSELALGLRARAASARPGGAAIDAEDAALRSGRLRIEFVDSAGVALWPIAAADETPAPRSSPPRKGG